MAIADYIQIFSLMMLFASVLVILYQVIIQNRLFKAQILKDRFEMYWTTFEPITDEQVKGLELYPEDFMDIEKYRSHYANNIDAIKLYIEMSKLYEFFVFINAQKKLKLSEPVGQRWMILWIKALVDRREFIDVHEYYRIYYPDLAKLIDDITTNKQPH